MRRFCKNALIFGFLFFLVSCVNKTIVEEKKDFTNVLWNEKDAQVFVVTITDTISTYNILYKLSNNNDYPYSNLFLFTEVNFPNGKKIVDTTEVMLATNDGRWLGKGWFGSHTTVFPFRMNIRFPGIGKYTFKIAQAMRCPNEELEGIESISLIVNKK